MGGNRSFSLSLTLSFSHSLILSFSHSLSLSHLLSHSLILSFSLSHLLSHSLISNSLICLLTHNSLDWVLFFSNLSFFRYILGSRIPHHSDYCDYITFIIDTNHCSHLFWCCTSSRYWLVLHCFVFTTRSTTSCDCTNMYSLFSLTLNTLNTHTTNTLNTH
jgi:hypothetical protein